MCSRLDHGWPLQEGNICSLPSMEQGGASQSEPGEAPAVDAPKEGITNDVILTRTCFAHACRELWHFMNTADFGRSKHEDTPMNYGVYPRRGRYLGATRSAETRKAMPTRGSVCGGRDT